MRRKKNITLFFFLSLTLGLGSIAQVEAGDKTEKDEVPFTVLDNAHVYVEYPEGWKVTRARSFSAFCKECQLNILSPSGMPVIDFTITREAFNSDRDIESPECRLIRIRNLADYIRELDCNRIAPKACYKGHRKDWVSPRIMAGGSCGTFLREAGGPIGNMIFFEKFLWRKGLHYYRNREVPMKGLMVVYDIRGVDDAVYRIEMIAPRKQYGQGMALFKRVLGSFRLRAKK